MNCLEFESWLQNHLDENGSNASPEADDHLSQCPRCLKINQAARLMQQGLELSVPFKANPLLTKRIVRRILADQKARSRRSYRTLALAAAVAALVILPTLSYLFPRAKPVALPSNPGSQVARNVNSPKNQKEPKDIEDPAPIGKNLKEAESLFAQVVKTIARQPKESATMLSNFSVPALPSVSKLEYPIDPATETLKKTGLGVSSGFYVVADSTRQAFDYFTRGIPSLDQNRKTIQ